LFHQSLPFAEFASSRPPIDSLKFWPYTTGKSNKMSLKFVLGGILTLAGIILVVGVIISPPFFEFATSQLWSSFLWGFIGFLVFLVGVWVMTR
jgi:uncharacterized protein YqhQ